MEQISVLDMLKIGVGPSSSHTLGPWRAAERWLKELKEKELFEKIETIKVHLYGSLSLTGKGHATDSAVILGLNGEDPEKINVEKIKHIIDTISQTKTLRWEASRGLAFDPQKDIIFENDFLPFHPNGITFKAATIDGDFVEDTFYSIGGGFVVKEGEKSDEAQKKHKPFPYPINSADDLLSHCQATGKSVSEIVMENERAWRSPSEIESHLERIWDTMLECMFIGCHTEGILPGGLKVRRRSFDMHKKLIRQYPYSDYHSWMETIRKIRLKFHEFFKWISCFALSVNEVNASLGRVVTAPTNGSAGVIPAVLMYYLCFVNKFAGEKEIKRFLLVAGEIGSIFKKGATISAAMGGCQAEIGVSSAMAAAALTELLGGSPEQVLIAAEISMEHHLGLTCDPVGGLVQIPCIERNSMGAVKAVNAAELALERNPGEARVPLDKAIRTMWETAKDMSRKYKETSEGGLAVAVNMADC